MRPKRRIALSREARWKRKVQTWPNMNSRRADTSDSTSNEEFDGPSRETSEEGGHRKKWLEDEVKPNQEELSEALNEGIRVPPSPQEEEEEEEDTSVVLKSKVGKAATWISSDSAKAQGSMQGQLHVESATSSRALNNTCCEKRSVSTGRGFDCTACGMTLFSVWDILEHPDLGVGICKVCYDFLFSSPYTKDKIDCSEEQCRWCGQGGRIVMCDHCDKVFCEACIVRNYGPKKLALIVQRRKWSCFYCDPQLLRVPVNELKQFQLSSVQLQSLSDSTNFPGRRKGHSWAGKLTTREASDIILGNEGGGATIAELLAQEEERRKQNNGRWTNSSRVKFTTQKVRSTSRKKKAANPELPTCAKVFPPVTEVKQEHELPNEKQEHELPSEKPQHELPIEKQQAPASATPPRTWIRPHQWVQKRQEAAERRKEAVAERLKNVTNLPNNGPKQNSNTVTKAK